MMDSLRSQLSLLFLKFFKPRKCLKKYTEKMQYHHFIFCFQASIKSTSPGHFPGLFGDSGGSDPGSSHIQMLLVTLGGVAVVFLVVCVAIFIAWRRSVSLFVHLKFLPLHIFTVVEVGCPLGWKRWKRLI